MKLLFTSSHWKTRSAAHCALSSRYPVCNRFDGKEGDQRDWYTSPLFTTNGDCKQLATCSRDFEKT